MSTCRNCGEPLEPGWAECPACETPVADPNLCPACNSPVKPNWVKCPRCRAPLGAGRSPSGAPSPSIVPAAPSGPSAIPAAFASPFLTGAPASAAPSGSFGPSGVRSPSGGLPPAGPVPELPAGEVLLGQFAVRSVLGRGATGTVYLADHLTLGEPVALKAVPTFGESAAVVQMLGAEYKAQRHVVDRRNVLTTEMPLACTHAGLDWVLLPMEPAEMSLREWLTKTADDLEARLEPGLDLLRQACRGLEAIHAAGLVHMDVKPENLLLVRDREAERAARKRNDAGEKWVVKVADFGLTRGLTHLADARPELFADGVGTPAYMAPEQVQAAHWRDVGKAADVYGLGMILFELLDGDLPYSGNAESIKAKKRDRDLRIRTPRGPSHLAKVALACMEREPEKRPRSAAELEKLISEDPAEEAAFAKAQKAGTEAGWEAFLKAYPEGRHQAEAATELSRLRREREEREARERSEAEKRRREEEARRAREAEEAKRRAEEEARKRAAEEEERKRREAEAARKRAAEERRKREEEEERRRREEEERKKRGYREVEPGHSWYPQQVSYEQRAEAQRLGIPLVIEETKSGIVLVLVPGGTYWMGASPGDGEASSDENPRHQVSVRPFYVGVGPVQQEQWEKVTGQNPANFKGARRPVEQVSWNDVQEFAKKVNAGRSGAGMRLPTEAEWEYFARAGTTTKYWWGDDYRERMANGRQGGPGQTTVMGSYPANPWGLLDVTGNVWEWCQDNYERAYGQTPTDGRAFENGGSSRVLRGGSWYYEPLTLRVSHRYRDDAALRSHFIGVRFVRDAVFP